MSTAKIFEAASMALMITSTALAGPECTQSMGPTGPCIECSVEVESPDDLVDNPPMLWDICHGALSPSPTIHFLPQAINVIARDGIPKQRLRTMVSGELLFAAQLQYKPWGRQDDLARIPLLAKLRQRFPALRLRPVVADRLDFALVGHASAWTERMRLTPSTVLDPFAELRLELVFRPAFAAKARAALSRELGVLGHGTMHFRAYQRDGSRIDAAHPLPLHVGGVSE